jgi:hypothetical protein
VVVSTKFTQVLSGALGAAVYTCLAQRAGAYLLETGGGTPDLIQLVGRPPIMFDWAAMGFLLLWNTKNLLDDFKAFDQSPDRCFHPLLTIFFSAACYTLLALSASTLFKGQIATQILVVYFLTMSIWSLTSWLRRVKDGSTEQVMIEKRRRRGRWVLFYAGSAAAIALSLALTAPWIFIAVIGVIYVVDCRDCGTFSLDTARAI